VGRYVKAAVTAVSKIKGLRLKVTPMSTILEAEKIETVLQAVIIAHEAVKALGAQRVSSTLRIDERLDKPRVMRDKVLAVSD
jgi:uncharacterized protein (TIGR00106 family)